MLHNNFLHTIAAQNLPMTGLLHGESKRRHYTVVYNFAKYWPSFKILSPAYAVTCFLY